MSIKIFRIISTIVIFSLVISLATVSMPQVKISADAGDLTVTGGPYLSLWDESVTGDDVLTYVELVNDLDGDGYLDVLARYAAGPSDNGIAEIIALKGSDGSILWRESVTGFGITLWRELVDDLSGDGLLDVIIDTGAGESGNRTHTLIAVQGNDGAHLWQQSITGENAWMGVEELADLDGDSDLDVLVRSHVGPTTNQTLSITAKIGHNGTHLWQESITGNFLYFYGNVIDDLNGDGKKDVLVRSVTGESSGTANVTALLGINGSHLWQQSVTGDDPFISAEGITDLDGDGLADVLVQSRVGSGASVNATVIAKHGSDGTPLWMEYVIGNNPLLWSRDVGDLNGDSLSDILVYSEVRVTTNTTAELIAKIGVDGTHLWSESLTGYSASIGVQAVDDFDGDSLPDVLTRSSVGPLINNWWGVTAIKGSDGTHLWQEAVTGESAYTQVQEVGDLDSDSMPDVLLWTEVGPDTNVTNTWISVKGSDGTHFWQHSKTGNGSSIWANNVGDVNGDSKPDFLLNTRVNEGGDSRTAQAIMKSGSDGTTLWQTGLFTGTDALSWLEDVGDFNGDGLADVLVGFDVGPSSANSVDMWARRGYDSYIFWDEHIFAGEEAEIWATIVEDLDGDGIQDALVHRVQGPDSNRTIELIARRGSGGTDFWQQSLTGEDASMRARGVDDIDGDGKTDVVVTQSLQTGTGMLYQVMAKNGLYGADLWMAESDPVIKLAYHQIGTAKDGPVDNDLDGDGKVEIVLYLEEGIMYGVGVDMPTSMESKYAFLPPTIDGEFSHGEWTSRQLLIEYPIPTNVYFSNDDDFLYVCVDAADETGGDFTQNGSDHCLLVFDTGHDEYTSEGRENMFKLYGNGNKEHRVIDADGSFYWVDDPECDFDACPAFPGLEGEAGFGTSPNSPLNHRIYEFQIPLSLLGASPGDTIGFASPIDPESIPYDGDTYRHNIWPSGATSTDLATWGDLVLASPSTAAVPTLSQWGMIGMGILFATALVWSVRRRWVNSTSKS
jgi:hypothetical protein